MKTAHTHGLIIGLIAFMMLSIATPEVQAGNKKKAATSAPAAATAAPPKPATKQVPDSVKRVLKDSITAFVNQDAWIGTVSIKKMTVTDDEITLKVSHALSCASLSMEQVDSLKRKVAEWTMGYPNDAKVYLFTETDDHFDEVEDLVTSLHSQKSKKHFTHADVTPLVSNADAVYETEQGLAGRHLAVYGSHGLYYLQKQDRWNWQRAKMFTTVEDLYTTSYTMPFLIPMLENAGAVVMQPRERDTQTEEIIIDNTEAVADGTWSTESTGGWGHPKHALIEGENPFRMGGYAYSKEKGSSMRYTPGIRQEGEYAVYVSYKTLGSSTDKALYKVIHRGVETRFHVNQQMGSGTWIYLGTFDFGKDADANYVEVCQERSDSHSVSTDAVRFGGGMGSVARYPNKVQINPIPSGQENGMLESRHESVVALDNVPEGASVSGYPRWIEGARYWFQYSGIPDSIYNYTESKDDYTDDYASRGRWMNFLAGGSEVNPDQKGLKIPLDLGLSFHTDAGTRLGDTIIGTLAIYTDWDNDKKRTYPAGGSRKLARDYADYMQTQLVNDVRATFAPEWTRRQLQNSSYAESRHPKLPVVLLEFLSHQNFSDMKYGLDPSFRFVVSRAIYKSMLRFLHEQYGTDYVVQPLPVQRFAIDLVGSDSVRLSWEAREDSLEATATPTYYVLYTRKGGMDWDNGVRIESNVCTLAQEKGVQYDYKVVAGNQGGISFPSEVLSACQAKNERSRVLIINGFTRVSAPEHFQADSTLGGFIPGHYGVGYMKEVNYIGEQYNFDRTDPWHSDDESGFGSCYTDKAKIAVAGNTFDYPAMHGRVLTEKGISYASTSAEAVSAIPAQYKGVDIIMGKQKEVTIGAQKVQTRYKTFTPNLQSALRAYSGKVLLSGAYISTDMKSEQDKEFTKKVLHYYYRTDQACKHGLVNIKKMLPKSQQEFETELNGTIIPCESPDGLTPAGEGAEVIARYDDNGVSAGVGYRKQMLIFGFMLESLKNFDTFYGQCADYLF